ncbi:MAG: hypothetical protein OXG85_04805 [Chloroflexi bacterium]|nr:hypothetical protein [Chloroflexota bacterium]
MDKKIRTWKKHEDDNLSVMEFLEKHHNGVYEFRYQTMKEAVFAFYCWGWHTATTLPWTFTKTYSSCIESTMRSFRDRKKMRKSKLPVTQTAQVC